MVEVHQLPPIAAGATAAASFAALGCMWACGIGYLTSIVFVVVGTMIGMLSAVIVTKRQQPLVSSLEKAKEVAGETWDYIIVGGGAAGCALANRLTAGKGGAPKKVLLLEAGRSDYNASEIKIPAGVLRLFQSKYDWHFQTSNEESIKDRSIYLCRGKVLGGSSSTNVCLYNRGDARDYDIWDTEFGCKGWKACDVLTDFTRTENDLSGAAETNPKHHGTSGELYCEHVRYQNPLSRCFLEACKQAGFPSNPDFNDWSRKQEGAGRFTVMTKKGARWSCANAFLKPALADKSRHLEVLTGASARKVLFDANGKATGVKFRADGTNHIVQLASGGEVLLAGGAIHSPQMLMLSGIGPKAHLEEMGIKVVADVPGVGLNLQDHPAAVVSYEVPENHAGISVSSKLKIPGTTIPHPKAALQWLFTGTGPLTSTGCDHGGFFRTSAAATPSPDLQMRFLAARAVTADGMQSFTQFRNLSTNHPDGFSFQSIAARPHSAGRLLLKSSDPDDKPIIEGNYLKDDRDVATIREGMKMARRLAKQDAFKDYVGQEVFPGPKVQSDKELDNYIRSTVHTANALVGTCRMGQAKDSMTVVDPDLKVKGVSGLRVIDSSVMPKLPGGQTVASTLMIVERAADMLLRSH